jgi:polyhydroxyalkanoate synthesis repressor PhaR
MIEQSGGENGSVAAPKQGPITIKKYANRRLYNTATSCYVTLDYLAQLVKAGAEFAVYDAKSGEDITRSVLTHIIVEEEAKGQSMLPVSFLRHLISFYGDSLQVVVPRYLDHTMHAFARNQEQMRDYLREAFDGLMPFNQFEEMSKHQLTIFERAMRLFNPFHGDEDAVNETTETLRSPTAAAQIEELRARLNQIQQQLDTMAPAKTAPAKEVEKSKT